MSEAYTYNEADYRSDRITKENRKKAHKKIQIKKGSKRHLIIGLLREVKRPLSADESSLILQSREGKDTASPGNGTEIIGNEGFWDRESGRYRHLWTLTIRIDRSMEIGKEPA